ncbi:hypothetical protein NQ318_020063 [Aromia moschata]|uniref:CHK kinase-like domain-containing protein n=1 Tax=Aromia moschata TaxID=1265417 RepID=A0AAV8ZB49_9CUCU|nr:hypothetical protein NQ318_020063 [Aromia moschata]
MIFDDVSLKNYKSVSGSLSYETIRVVFKQLAKMHACSLLYEEIQTQKQGKPLRIDEKYNDYIQETILGSEEMNDINKLFILGVRTNMKYILDSFPDIPRKLTREEFKDKVMQAYKALFNENIRKNPKFRNVLCQGDCWGGNVLIRKEDDDQFADDAYIIDYQLTRYCPPAHDLLVFMYMAATKETRQKYMSRLLRVYYQELDDILERYDHDLKKIYAYEEFLECVEYMKYSALCISLCYMQITNYPAEKMMELMKDEERTTYAFSIDRKELMEEFEKEGPYRHRIKEIVEDLYKVCENDSI